MTLIPVPFFQYDYVELLRDVVHGVEDDNSSAVPMLATSLTREKRGGDAYELESRSP